MVNIRITGWDEEAAWTGFAAYHPRGSLRCLTFILIAAPKTQRNTSKPIANCQKYF